MRANARGRTARLLTGMLIAGMVALSGMGATAGLADPGEREPASSSARAADAGRPLDTQDASLVWGVTQALRDELVDAAPSEGAPELLGETHQAEEHGALTWTGGTGRILDDGSRGDVAFRAEDGVRLRIDPSAALDQEHAGLDLALTEPRLVISAPGEAELRMSVVGRDPGDPPGSEPRISLEDAPLATIELPAPVLEDGRVSYIDSPATLSDEGARVFAGLIEPGERPDPITFTTGAAQLAGSDAAAAATRAGEPDPASRVSLALSASKTSLTTGEELELVALLEPRVGEGTVEFRAAQQKLGRARLDADGTARLVTRTLTAGTHEITATFTSDGEEPATVTTGTPLRVQVTAIPPKTGKAVKADLSWGVKSSFRNYIYNFTAFEGKTSLLGSARQPEEQGVYRWSGGSGTVNDAGTAADLGFGAGNGVHFQSHPMTVGGRKLYALDLQFTNPRVEITSATSGALYLDVVGREFKSMTEAGEEFELRGVRMADLRLPAFTQRQQESGAQRMQWDAAQASLTKEGARAFGGFYRAGESLDPVSFSLSTELTVEAKKPTTTKLAVTPDSLEQGGRITATATVSPDLEGEVEFSSGSETLGEPVQTTGGRASFSTSALPIGIHMVTATFTPRDDAYGASFGSAKVTVMGKQAPAPAPSPTAATGAVAGSLRWGVSAQFVAYTTCEGKERFGMSHCAKGSINTSGVGAGYLFPQAGGSDWNPSTQTGTVRYSGNVAFSGYGETLFNVTNPSITVTGPNTATLSTGNRTRYGAASYDLNLAAGTKTVGPNGEVTWEGVPVPGSLTSGGAGGSGNRTIGLDALTFTVGAASGVQFGATSAGADAKVKRTPAATPPASTGIKVLTPADKIKAGGRIELEASGFTPGDTGVLVVLYSDPIVLDEEAAADSRGIVTWSGSLPKDVTGAHTITFQGSNNSGAVIDILDEKTKQSARNAPGAARADDAGVEESAHAGAGLLGADGPEDWEWWASAGGLVVIAACMSFIAYRQRFLLG